MTDFPAFLRTQAATQAHGAVRYQVQDNDVWIKKAGAPHSVAHYRILGAVARLLRLPLFAPVPNPGGSTAIATEARRLRALAALGVHVPEILAVQGDALLIRHMGIPGQDAPSLANEIQDAIAAGPGAVLALWQQGLHAIAQVHAQGGYLSQAFARNLVRCGDGAVGFIDFEDDPGEVLSLPLCQARDALCYVHSSALALQEAGALAQARALWADWLTGADAQAQAALADTVRRLALLRRLPQNPRLGRDLRRARAGFDLMAN